MDEKAQTEDPAMDLNAQRANVLKRLKHMHDLELSQLRKMIEEKEEVNTKYGYSPDINLPENNNLENYVRSLDSSKLNLLNSMISEFEGEPQSDALLAQQQSKHLERLSPQFHEMLEKLRNK